jgi:poly-gamma-glutamate synthesis protein (capsule biosynthesis protein)
MTLLRNIFSFILITLVTSIIGGGVGMSVFYGFKYIDTNYFTKSSIGSAQTSASALPEVALSKIADDEGFYYKPLPNRSVEISKEGKVVLADLNTMSLRLYKDGQESGNFPIVSKGRPGSFWETPTGEYRALTKEERHFSSIGGVWMPYSVGFFGNFFIHGWPTYDSGAPVREGYSGGCIRLKTNDAKIVYEFIEKNTLIIVVENADPTIGERGYVMLKQQYPPKLSAEAFLVADLDNNFVFLEKNREEVKPIASITKLMSAIVSLEAINQEKEVAVQGDDLDIYGDTGRLVAGEIFSAKNLLMPLLLSSSNDAAYTLARILGTGRFVELMNEKAKAIKLSKTRFSDPSGLEMTNVSSAEDLLYLLKYIRDVHAPLLDISQKRQMKLQTNKTSHTWYNFNWKSGDALFAGGKVGYISAAGKTMVALFRVPVSEFISRDIGVAVLGSDDQEKDIKKLVAYVQSNFVYGSLYSDRVGAQNQSNIKNEKAGVDEPFTMLFTGDIMLDRGIRAVVENRSGGNYFSQFEKIADVLTSADITFGNLEGPISDKGQKQGSIYSFRMDPAATKALYDAGFDIVNIANNHAGDYGREAMDDTLSRLARAGIAYTGAGKNGAQATKPIIIERGGVRVGFSDVGPNWLRADEALSGVALADVQTVTDAVRQAREVADILVVSFHFGEEYQTRSNARQQELAHAAIDAGAKIIIGHHPHVAQETEEYKGGIIAYSLGNFIFDQAFSDETKEALVLKIQMKGKSIEKVEKIQIKFNEYYQPELKQ